MGLSALFDSRFKFRVHMVQLSLISLVVLLSIVRIAIALPQRAHIMGIAIGIKSILFISYQLLTEHTVKFQKWASPKANFILNVIDIPFWAVIMFLLFQANARFCAGAACGVSWVMAALAIVIL
ncbi:hypothetical protein Hte_010938 [Hypoxylon texense]